MANIVEIIASPDDLTTTNFIAPSDTFTGELQTPDDTDWIAIDLLAGVTYTFTFMQNGGSLADPYL